MKKNMLKSLIYLIPLRRERTQCTNTLALMGIYFHFIFIWFSFSSPAIKMKILNGCVRTQVVRKTNYERNYVDDATNEKNKTMCALQCDRPHFAQPRLSCCLQKEKKYLKIVQIYLLDNYQLELWLWHGKFSEVEYFFFLYFKSICRLA